MVNKIELRWKALAEEHDVAPYPHPVAYVYASTTRFKDLVGKPEAPWIIENKKGTFRWCGVESTWVENAKHVLTLLENPAFFARVSQGQRDSVRAFLARAREVQQTVWRAASNDELATGYARLFDAWMEMNVWGHVVQVIDFDHNIFTQQLTRRLEHRIRESGSGITPVEAFAVLAYPSEKSQVQQQEEDFYALLTLAATSGIDSSVFEKAVQAHAKRYDWMQYHYSGPTILDVAYFRSLVESELSQGVSGEEKLREIQQRQASQRERRLQLIDELGLDEKDRYWFDVAGAFMCFKEMRKEAVFEGCRCAAPFFAELGRRLGVTPWLAQFIGPHEIQDALNGKILRAELEERERFSVYLADANQIRSFIGDEAKAYASRIYSHQAQLDAREMRGSPACAGTARGVVKLVAKADDMAKMNDGDILISPATNPNLVPAVKKAAAILTDEGGITCHASIVSRELGIPCVVGLRSVTRWLKDGDLVEVNASTGIVRKIGDTNERD